MTRVLHLIDHDRGRACPTTLAMLAALLREAPYLHQDVLLAGGYRLARAAELAGITSAERVGVPMGNPLLAITTVARRIGEMEAGVPYDVIHCWSMDTLRFADLALRHRLRMLTLQRAPESPRTLRRLARRDAAVFRVITPNAYAYERLREAGLSPRALRFVFPPIEPDRLSAEPRDAIRESWPIDPERSRVIALLSDPPAEADAYTAAMAVGLCAEALAADPSNHCDLRVLVHPQQHHRRRAQHLNDMLGLSDRVIQDPRIASPWSILAGCDAALAIGPSGGGPSLAWAMAAGLPIVGEARRPITDRAPDGETAMLVEPGKPRLMADRLRHCFTERYGPQSITERAARRAREKFTPQAFCKVMLGVYGCD